MQILIFVGLKVVEISALVFIPYGIGLLIKKYSSILDKEPIFMVWLLGLVASVMAAGVVILGVALFLANWKWAGKLINLNE